MICFEIFFSFCSIILVNTGLVINKLQWRHLFCTSNGRPIAILTGVNEETFEDELDALQRGRALKALDSIQRESEMKGTSRITSKKIQLEIDAVRKGNSS